MMDKYKILNRDAIKYIAMFLMLLNHISTIFMKSGKLWSELFIDLGFYRFGIFYSNCNVLLSC